MSWGEFEGVLFTNLNYFLLNVSIIFIILYSIFKKNIFNIFDPLIFLLINFSSCFTVILYLIFFNSETNKNEIIIIFIINIIFLLTLKLKLMKKNISIGTKIRKKQFKIYYFLHTFFFLLVILLFFKMVGLKLVERKLIAFSNIGWLNYMRTFFIPSQLILILIKREIYKLKAKKDLGIIIIIIIMYLISGSKVGIVNMIILIFTSLYYINKKYKSGLYLKLKKNIRKMIALVLLSIIIGFSLRDIKNIYEIERIFSKILLRVISTGDIYYMMYVKNNITKITSITLIDYYFIPIFKPILKYFINLEEKIGIGFQVVKVIYNITTKEFGPNTRYDVVWQLNFGYFGIIGGYLSATLVAFIRRIRTQNFYILNLLLLLLVNSESILTDFAIFGGFLFSIILCFIPLVIISKIIIKFIGE